MKFNILKPCPNCPFRVDRPKQRGWLGYHRAREIALYVLRENKTFQCHKTIGKANDGCMCAGALSMLAQASKKDSPYGNAMIQIAERLGLYNPAKLDTSVPVFKTAMEMAEFHENEFDKR